MSFAFKWDAFAGQRDFQSQIRELLTNALNKKLPSILEDKITVLNLDWGNEAPSLEMLEIGDVAMDRFRGVFKLNYNGGANITVATKVQANLLNVYKNSTPSLFTTPKFVDADASFPIQLHLTLRKIRLQGTVIVVFSKSKGLTLVFRNDPLQSIEVSSTFDTFPTIASYLQQQIENQIRGLFREEVPAVLYQLSLKYLPTYSHNVVTDQAQKAKLDDNEHPVAFADIESDKPVSLVNILHVEAMLSSRYTLALETPVMPTAIVRSELHHRSLLSRLKSPTFSLKADSDNIYDQLYNHAKYTGMRSAAQKQPKRRVVRLHKKENAAIMHSAHTHHVDTSIEVKPYASSETSSPNSFRGLMSHRLTDTMPHSIVQSTIPLTVPTVEPFARKFATGDTKGLHHFGLRGPQQFLFHTPSHHDELRPLAVHEIDELPPAYVA